MFVTIQTKEILKGLSKAMKFVPNNTTVPILSNLKFCATAESITLTGSDSKESIEITIPVDGAKVVVEKAGSVIVPKLFNDIIKKMGDKVSISVDSKNEVTIKSADAKLKSEMKLKGLDVDDYPRFPASDSKPTFTMKGTELAALIKKVTYAVGDGKSRPILAGICFMIKDSELILTGTDSHRLARVVRSVDTKEELDAVVDGKSLDSISKIIETEEKEVSVIMTENFFFIKTEDTVFYSSLLDGTYPDTSKIIMNSFDHCIQANRSELLRSVERLILVSEIGSMNLKGEELLMAAKNKDGNRGGESIFVKTLEGEDFTISFNLVYLYQTLQAIDSKDVYLHFRKPLDPFVITEKETSQEVYNLILPVRVQN